MFYYEPRCNIDIKSFGCICAGPNGIKQLRVEQHDDLRGVAG